MFENLISWPEATAVTVTLHSIVSPSSPHILSLGAVLGELLMRISSEEDGFLSFLC